MSLERELPIRHWKQVKRIAVIGCGAIADSFHIPALKHIDQGALEITLVDPDPARRAVLGKKHGITDHASTHEQVADRIDAAVIASPHHTHVPIARDLVEAGVAVLSEKPLGTTVAEVEGLRDLAERKGVTVAVNQTRRFIPACRRIREILSSGELGEVVHVDIREGDRFDWPAATPSMFGARAGGKGLLLDIGAHVLDLMVWWFGADLEIVDYADDSFGGSEASAMAVLQGPSCRIDMRLSWLAKQTNSYRFTGEQGALSWSVYDLDEIKVEKGPQRRAYTVRVPSAARSFADLAPLVIEDFLEAARSGSAPVADSAGVLPSMRLMEACYARRRTYAMPWHAFQMEKAGG